MQTTFVFSMKTVKNMKKWGSKCLFCAFIALSQPTQAQLLAVNNPVSGSNTAQDWVFFTDNERQVLYIDFEQVSVNMNGVVVKNKAGEIVFKDEELWQLPVNTIYEIDLSKYPKGTYNVELKTFTHVLKKDIVVR